MSKKCKRKTDFIDPEVQGALTRRIVAQWVVFTVVAAALALGLAWMDDPFAPVMQTLANAWWTYAPLLLVLVCLLPVFVMDTVKLSNKFTGPMFRVRQFARQLSEGQTPDRLEFRGNDFWHGLADDMNSVIDRDTEAEQIDEVDSHLTKS